MFEWKSLLNSPDSAPRLLPPLQTLGLVLCQLSFVEQNLVFSVLVRVRVLLINHGHFAVGVVRGCLVGVVVTASLNP
jgi:hypothetical protein